MKLELFVFVGICIISFALILERDWVVFRGWLVALLCQGRILLYCMEAKQHKTKKDKK